MCHDRSKQIVMNKSDMNLFSKSMMPVPSNVSKPKTFFSIIDTLSSAMPVTKITKCTKASSHFYTEKTHARHCNEKQNTEDTLSWMKAAKCAMMHGRQTG
jgi:hypothetical protein